MIFADKLIRLRKKAGWSQEELAAQMNVSRQSVSKWESAQSIPDLDKIIRLSQLFGVSTDYLLKDELEDMEETAQPIQATEETAIRKVTIEEANQFIKRISKQFLDLTLCNSANGGKACIYGLFRHLLYGRTIRI